MASPSNNKKIAKNTLYLYIRMFLLLFVGFYTTRVVLRTLGVDDFGLYNVIAGFVAMVAFVNTSISNSIQRFLNFEMGKGGNGDVNKYFSIAISTQLVITVFILTLAETIGLWFVNNKLNIPVDRYFAANVVYQVAIFTLVLKILQSPFQAIIIAKEKMNFYAYLSLLEVFFQLGIAFVLGIVVSYKLEIYSILLFIIAISIFVWNVTYSRKIQQHLPLSPTYDKEIFKKIFSFCGWNLFGSASGVIQNQGINILINVFFGVTVNAARGVAFQVYAGVQCFISNFQLAMNPQIVQSYAAGDKNRYLQLCYANFKVSVYLMWFIALPLLICCPNVLGLWLGDNVPDQTITFVDVILLTGVVEALGSSISVPLYATGNIRNYQLYVSLTRFLALPIAYYVYYLGYPAVSSMVVCLVVDVLAQILRVLIWTSETKSSNWYYVKSIVIPLVIVISITTLICYEANQLIPACSPSLHIIIITLISLLINITCVLFISLSKNERVRIVGFARKKLHL